MGVQSQSVVEAALKKAEELGGQSPGTVRIWEFATATPTTGRVEDPLHAQRVDTSGFSTLKWVSVSTLETPLSSGVQRAEMKSASGASVRCYFLQQRVFVHVHVHACAHRMHVGTRGQC